MTDRRSFLKSVFAIGAGAVATARAAAQGHEQHGAPQQAPPPGAAPRAPRRGPQLLVETPDIPTLPYEMDGNVKVFQLIAEPVKRELIPGRVMEVWGFNGSCPGPTLQANQGDRVRVILENRLPEPTTMHWHGFEIPVQMDGMPYISQKPIPPGGKFVYEFTLHQEGTFFYHSHGAMQEMMGMVGMFVLHPRDAYRPRVDHDFGIILQGWALLPNNPVPNTAAMEFNWLTFNGKAGPATTPLIIRQGNRVRIRLVNLSMDHHPIHIHGHTFVVTGSEAGRLPAQTWQPGNTALVGVAQARDIEFVADNPGDWMIHCHLPHHMMNNMSDLMGERLITTSPLTPAQAEQQMQMMQAAGGHGAHGHQVPAVPRNAERVPGFPQDAFMEMPMDQAVMKPENYGLAENWSAGMMGMMSLFRVLPGPEYDRIQELRARAMTTGTTAEVQR